ncbi:MAG: hypothetical protein JST26_06490 [Bacteroidetes bacterium]|nr:hypothetical protein [Bacteroidota bacterium]
MNNERLISISGSAALIIYLFLWRFIYLKIRHKINTPLAYSILVTSTLISLMLYAYLLFEIFTAFVPGILEAICMLVTIACFYLSAPAILTTIIMALLRLSRKTDNS